MLFTFSASAAESAVVVNRAAQVRLGLEQIMLPNDEVMGMLGTTYLIEVAPEIHAGGAAYGAISGQRGGFFTIGGELAWQHQLSKRWKTIAGIYAGGGGGGSATALVGGGLMLRPHLDLVWNFGGQHAGLSVSRVLFPSGQISSNQLGLIWSADAEFSQFLPVSGGVSTTERGRGGVGFDRVHAVMGTYHGIILPSHKGKMNVGLVGFRMEKMLDQNLYWGIEAAGAASGGVGGYAEYLGTLGMETPLWQERSRVGIRAAMGMGGGGAVSVGGGALGKLGAYASARLGRNAHAGLEFGYASAPDGKLRARYAAANLTLDLDHPYTESGLEIDRYEWHGGVGRYASTAHRDGSVSQMDAVMLKVNRYLGDDYYLSGQAHSAFRGKEGGYSAGLFGMGYRLPLFTDRLAAGAEMLLGAAGGGAVDSSGGAIMLPNLFLDWRLDEQFALRTNVGRLKSFSGALNTLLVDVSIRFSYAAARH